MPRKPLDRRRAERALVNQNTIATDLLSVTSDLIDRDGWSNRPCKVISSRGIYNEQEDAKQYINLLELVKLVYENKEMIDMDATARIESGRAQSDQGGLDFSYACLDISNGNGSYVKYSEDGYRGDDDNPSAFLKWAEKHGYIDKNGDYKNILYYDPPYREIADTYEEVRRVQIGNTISDVKDSKKCEGLSFVITGKVHTFKNRDAFTAYVKKQGGHVSGSVTTDTDFLVNNDLTSSSTKNKKAKELGVEIITEDQFIERFMNQNINNMSEKAQDIEGQKPVDDCCSCCGKGPLSEVQKERFFFYPTGEFHCSQECLDKTEKEFCLSQIHRLMKAGFNRETFERYGFPVKYLDMIDWDNNREDEKRELTDQSQDVDSIDELVIDKLNICQGKSISQIKDLFEDPNLDIPLDGTQYEGRAERCEELHTGTELQYKIVKDKLGYSCLECFNKGESVGVIHRYFVSGFLPLLKLGNIDLTIKVKNCLTKSKRGTRAKKADVSLTILLVEKTANEEPSEANNIAARVQSENTASDVQEDKRCEGLSFVITGKVHTFKNRDEFTAYVNNQGGHVSGSVSVKTDFLVNNDLASTSVKNKKAKELGVEIITEDQFIEKFGH